MTPTGQRLADHLFRREAGRMVAVLVRAMGVEHLALAEDAVQDALVRALEAWRYGGTPENPAAWLMRTARNRAIDLLRRGAGHDRAAPALARALEAGSEDAAAWGRHPVADDELRLMFSCCDPGLQATVQVVVILKLLCGFSVREVARAFLASEGTVEKQLYRARRLLADRGALFEVRDPGEVRRRVEPVRRAIYLLFNEGYHGASARQVVREELCHEALRLGELLSRLPAADGPETQALLALLCLLAARLPARLDDDGNLLLLAEQDRSRWDRALVAEGLRRLGRSASGPVLSAWHLEAAIAAQHARASGHADTDWPAILRLFDLLVAVQPSPVVALNRAIALGMAEGPEAGLAALQRIPDRALLASYPFLPAAVAEFELRAGRPERAAEQLRSAQRLARNPAEAALLARKLRDCGGAG